jgi:hypothetical protein
MPVGYIFVSDARSDIKHDNGTLPLNVVTVTEPAEFFLHSKVNIYVRPETYLEKTDGQYLAGGIPNVKPDGPSVCVEHEGMDLHAESGDVLLLKLPGQMALHKSGLSSATVADKDQLEGWHILLGSHFSKEK